MPVLVGRIKGNASKACEIVIRSVGSDGMEINRDILSLAEAERLIRLVRRAIGPEQSLNGSAANGVKTTAIRGRGESVRIETDEPRPNLDRGIGDSNDHCLQRWEDDGGKIKRVPSERAARVVGPRPRRMRRDAAAP